MINQPNVNNLISTNIVETDAGCIDFGFIEYIGKTPGMVHYVTECGPESVVTLENRSKWIVANIDMVRNWKIEDELFITQNQAFFSTHRFALVNPRLHRAVAMSLLREPLPIGDKTSFILSIDLSNDVIALTNGLEYSVYSHDHGTLRKYSENDRVLMGFNSSDKLNPVNLEYYKCYLIINTTCNSYIRVNPIS